MSMAKIYTAAAAAAVALLLVFALPGSADARWHGKVYPRVHVIHVYPPFGRIYTPYPWGYPAHHLGWRYPMFGEWIGRSRWHGEDVGPVRLYYYQLPPYWDCCW